MQNIPKAARGQISLPAGPAGGAKCPTADSDLITTDATMFWASRCVAADSSTEWLAKLRTQALSDGWHADHFEKSLKCGYCDSNLVEEKSDHQISGQPSWCW
eukprot:s72_g52.t1